MICRVGNAVYRGRYVTVDQAVGPAVVARAVREGRAAGEFTVSVRARRPHDAHEVVGCLRPGQAVQVRAALVGAARSRGHESPYDERLTELREKLAECESEHLDSSDQRLAVAQTRAETDALRERVAALRGRLDVRRELDISTEDAKERLEEAIRELSEAETERAAAEQALEKTRRRTRRVHDALEERFRLEDEIANLERRARRWLVERVRPAYESALATVPSGAETLPTDPLAVDGVTAGLAVARVATLRAPVVLACDRFGSARAASAWLGAPVILLPT